jgi:hypothetical protein
MPCGYYIYIYISVSENHTASIVRAEDLQVLTETSMKFRVFWFVAPCSHVEVSSIEAVRTSETSVNFNVITWRYIPEDG